MPSPRNTVWIPLALAAIVAVLYAPTAHFAFLNYDDPDYVANSHVLAGLTLANLRWAFTSAYAANWFPLTWISHMLDRNLFGHQPGAQHLMNVALHALATLLLYTALRRLTHQAWPSAFVALIFAIHPLHIESVAWVAERKDVLSAVFFFTAIWAYAIYSEHPSPFRYAAVTLAVCCALMSKPTTVTLPFVFLLLDYWPLRRTGPRRLLLEKAPWIALSIAVSIVTYLVQQHAGAVFAAAEIPLALRLENAVVSYAIYLLKFFAPFDLAVFYPYPASIPVWQASAAAALLAAVSAAVFFAQRRYLVTGWLWFLGTLLPMIGLIQAGLQSRADRYTYLPLTGLAVMLAWGSSELWETRKPALAIAAGAVAVAMIAATCANLQNWRDSITLFRHAIAVTQSNYVAYNNLGVALRRGGHIADSIPLFESAIRFHPSDVEAQNNLGEALMLVGHPDQALPHVLEALRLNPGLAEAHINLGALFNKRGQFDEGAKQYQLALHLDPENAEAHAGLGITLTELHRYEEALPQLLQAVHQKPDSADVHYNLGRLYGLAGRTGDAIAEFSATVQLDPANAQAHFNLGTAFAQQNRIPEAEQQFREAVHLNPADLNAHFNLASALATQGRYNEAIPEFSEVLRLDPNFTSARQALDECRRLCQ